MGNIIQTEPFRERNFQELDEHLNKFINKYAKFYSEQYGLSDSITWKYILSIDLDSDCFARLKQMNQGLYVPILDLIIDLTLSNTTMSSNIIFHGEFFGKPIKLLEYWCEIGMMDELEDMYGTNKFELDFTSLHCPQNQNYISIGYDALNKRGDYDHTKLIVPFKNKKSMYLCIAPAS